MIPGSVKGGIIITLAVIGLIGNLLVILVVAAKRKLHTMYHFLLASLALSDFFLHFFVIFVAVSQISEQWVFGIAWCKGNQYILQCLGYTTIYLLCAVTWECHTAVVTPFDFSSDITVKKTTVVVLLWIASFVFGAGPFFGWGGFVSNDKLHRCEKDYKSNVMINSLVIIILFFILPFGLITKQQFQISRIAKHHRSQIAQQQHAINVEEDQQQRRLMKHLKESKDALIIGLAFVVSYLPICITTVLRKILQESEELYNTLFLVLVLCQLGATWNPFIYCFRNRRFRRELLQFFCINTFKRVAPQVISLKPLN